MLVIYFAVPIISILNCKRKIVVTVMQSRHRNIKSALIVCDISFTVKPRLSRDDVSKSCDITRLRKYHALVTWVIKTEHQVFTRSVIVSGLKLDILLSPTVQTLLWQSSYHSPSWRTVPVSWRVGAT